MAIELYVALMGCAGISGGCAAVSPCPPAELVQAPPPQAIPVVAPSSSALQQKMKVQEKRIAELSMQLKMLKRMIWIRISHERLSHSGTCTPTALSAAMQMTKGAVSPSVMPGSTPNRQHHGSRPGVPCLPRKNPCVSASRSTSCIATTISVE